MGRSRVVELYYNLENNEKTQHKYIIRIGSFVRLPSLWHDLPAS